jgi:hypothetical protein
MKAFYHELPEDNVEEGESADKTVVLLAHVKDQSYPAWVSLWIDRKKPKVYYFQPVLNFRNTGEEMKHQFDYDLSSDKKYFVIRDLFKGEKSQFMYIYGNIHSL